MTLDYIIAAMTYGTTVPSHMIVSFVIPLVSLLTSMPMMWSEEHLWNVSVLQRVHLSNLVIYKALFSNSSFALHIQE
jgi:hypothetical protein